MSAELDCARAAAECARRCAADFYPIRVTVLVVQAAGAQFGVGPETVISSLELTPCPVTQVSSRVVAASGGTYQMGDIRVGPITPRFPGGGFTAEQVDPRLTFSPAPTERRAVIYRLSGQVTGDYALVSLDNFDPVDWYLVLRSTRRSQS